MLKNKAARIHMGSVQPEHKNRSHVKAKTTPARSASPPSHPVAKRRLRIVPLDEEDRGEDFFDGAMSNRVTPDD